MSTIKLRGGLQLYLPESIPSLCISTLKLKAKMLSLFEESVKSTLLITAQ